MISTNSHEQTIIEFAQGGYLAITVESFLIDRQAAGLSRYTLKFYRQFLNPFITYCNANSLTLIQQITPDYLRRYFLTSQKPIIQEAYTLPTGLYGLSFDG